MYIVNNLLVDVNSAASQSLCALLADSMAVQKFNLAGSDYTRFHTVLSCVLESYKIVYVCLNKFLQEYQTRTVLLFHTLPVICCLNRFSDFRTLFPMYCAGRAVRLQHMLQEQHKLSFVKHSSCGRNLILEIARKEDAFTLPLIQSRVAKSRCARPDHHRL